MVKFCNYKDVSDELKIHIANEFTNKYRSRYTKETIIEHWANGYRDNKLVVMFDNLGVFLGVVGVHHMYYYIPIVSHLYIEPNHRDKGYGTLLMNEVTNTTNRRMYLWCLPEKIEYYENMGWKKNFFGGIAPVFVTFYSLCKTGLRMVSMTRKGTKYG
jgi:GNAT superfamily N-acetyltransferase